MNPKFQAGQIIVFDGCIAEILRFIDRRNGTKVYEMKDIVLNKINQQRKPGDVNQWGQSWVESRWRLFINPNKIWNELNISECC